MTILTAAPKGLKAANWIWLDGFDDAAAAGQFVLFRKIFLVDSLDSIPSDQPIPLQVSADTRYRLYLNGHSISFGPCKSYLGRWNYETVDNIRPWLREGQNVLAARVLRFSSTHPGCLSMIRSAQPGFLLACSLPQETIATDTSWKCYRDEATKLVDDDAWDYRLGPQFLGLNETVDGRLSLSYQNWTDVEYSDSTWPMAVIQRTSTRKMSPMLTPHRLVPREIPALTEEVAQFDGATKSSGSDSLSTSDWTQLVTAGVPVTVPANTVHTVDIFSSALTTGFIDLQCTLDGPEDDGVSVQLLYSECYETPWTDGQPRNKGDRTDFTNGELYGPSDTYTPHKGDNHYSPFWWRTFRYIHLTVTTAASPITFTGLSYRSTHYPLRVASTIQSSSPLLNDLWTVSLRTLQNCMHETYEDCPFYEQNQFAMDARTQILLTYLVSRDDRLARKTMRGFYASRRDDGLVETHYPCPGRAISIPTFSLFWVLMVWDHMVYFGDEALVRYYLGGIDGVLGYFERHLNEQGLVGQFDVDSGETWAFVDWVDEWRTPGRGFTGMAVPRAYYSHGAATFHSLLYAYTLLKASELCTFAGRHDTAREYKQRHGDLVAAVKAYCFDKDSGFFLDGPGTMDERSQHVQVFAVLAGCLDSEEEKHALMRKSVLEREKHSLAQASFAMGFYVFRAVALAGVYEECWPTLIQPWQTMLDQNLTTWAESSSMVRSDCHGWSAVPLYEIVTEVLGVEYRSAAYVERGDKREKEERNETIRIAPRRALADNMEASIVVGDISEENPDVISVAWEKGQELVLSTTRKEKVEVQVKKETEWVTKTFEMMKL
ncbi:hypothetical protein SBRCBS47491_006191 [Sporothrix bragantina]|uniref:Alpha-L-rhamnosidase six-hairpin glycosidase domain-containing protein n=1 Tax=Sporothrix bragantina TaxID=671064 RepID=A0ABP0C575_9PEZI